MKKKSKVRIFGYVVCCSTEKVIGLSFIYPAVTFLYPAWPRIAKFCTRPGNCLLLRLCLCLVISQVKVSEVRAVVLWPLSWPPTPLSRCPLRAYAEVRPRESHSHINAWQSRILALAYSKCQTVSWETRIEIEQRRWLCHCCCCGNEAGMGSDVSDAQRSFLLPIHLVFVHQRRDGVP